MYELESFEAFLDIQRNLDYGLAKLLSISAVYNLGLL